MSQKWVIDKLLPQIKEIDTKDIIDNPPGLLGVVTTINIKYGETIIPTVVWRKNIFDDKITALKEYEKQLKKELLSVQYEIKRGEKNE